MAVGMRRRNLDPVRRRPGGGRARGVLRLVIVIVLLIVVVTAVRSVLRSSDTGPDNRLVYVDQVRPSIDTSTRLGASLDDLRQNGARLGADGLRRSLDRLVTENAAVFDTVEVIRPPSSLDASRGLLLAALKARSVAVTRIAGALGDKLAPDAPTDPVITAIVDAGRDLVVADRAYELFTESLPEEAKSAAPASRWVGESDVWDRPSVSAFIASLRANASVAPVHDVGIVTVVTEPTSVGKEGEARIIPDTKTLIVRVVVANLGNAPEKRVSVEAVATSLGGLNVGRQFVDLDPGQRRTVELKLTVAPGDPISVTIKVGPVSGETNLSDNEVQPAMLFVRRGAAPEADG
ncbi:MAG: hypothetical protein ACR2H3_14745 [Acidimicrobiales bacterium]